MGCTQGAVLLQCAHVWGLMIKILLWGSNLAALVFFLYFFVYSVELVSSEPSVSVEDRLSSILQIRDETLFCFLLTFFPRWFSLYTHVSTTPHCRLFSSLRLFFCTSNEPISLYLTSPLSAHSTTICLKWPHLALLILFIPIRPFPSFLTLSFITCICPSSVYFVLKFNNDFHSLLLYFQLLFLPSPAISPSTLHPFRNTHLPPLWALIPFPFVFWFTLHLFTAFFLRSPSTSLLLPSELISISPNLQQKFHPCLIYMCFKVNNL